MRYYEIINESKYEPTMYHGSPSGELVGSHYGIHLGTYKAAEEAITARIGYPVEGSWDGSREYGKTLLMGKNTMKDKGIFPTGYNTKAPDNDYYPKDHPEGFPIFSGGDHIKSNMKPSIKKYKIVGKMTNTPNNPMSDTKANSTMKSMISRGSAKNGYYYKNDGEDVGSISAVVPNKNHIIEV